MSMPLQENKPPTRRPMPAPKPTQKMNLELIPTPALISAETFVTIKKAPRRGESSKARQLFSVLTNFAKPMAWARSRSSQS